MESRDLWERNTVLAEAFCASDDRMRHARSLLERARADRTRALAAFAVSIGSDGGVAKLMGLSEREVRQARRVVGKADARGVAEELLSRHATAAPPQEREAEPKRDSPPAVLVPLPAGDRAAPYPRPETTPSTGRISREEAEWTPSMDAVLLWSWQSGLDLNKVAAELGVDYRALLLRVQQLGAEGRLPAKPVHGDTSQAGRHRRHETPHIPIPDSPASLYDSYSYPYI
ncbi:hypothetical protein [Streptomyces sp. H27-H5]|uniref:hypothetical protein n=1 Tax=Streptomyces sp. H27-H5 TaxID=2996460 RepID=UPI00226E3CE0|nr:hypothetical protein [Streptomyces sp. H27-H5]MCY0963117.1 hypothetical protein [Streptomyces sp. H27-H5]